MRRLSLIWVLALGLLWAACGDDSDNPILPPGDGNTVDLSTFTGCWHVRSLSSVYGSGPCRTALDSVVDILTVAGIDSVFAVVDTVNDLLLVPPYYGYGDFTGTSIAGRRGAISAEYHHAAGACSLITRFAGDISASGDTAFYIFYTVNVSFEGDTLCTNIGDCDAAVTFTCIRRPDSRCEP